MSAVILIPMLLLLIAASGAPCQRPLASDRSVTPPPSASMRPELVMAQQYELSDSDIGKIMRGKIVVKGLPASGDREFTLLGVIRVPGSHRQFMDLARDPGELVTSDYVRAVGSISPDNVRADVARLAIHKKDVKAVRSCTLGDCDLKLPAEMIQRVSQLDDKSKDFKTRVPALVQQWLSDYLAEYVRDGNQALPIYRDRKEPQSLEAGLAQLLAQAHVLQVRAPELYQYLVSGREPTWALLANGYVWSVEDFGLRPLTTITQSTIYISDDAPGEAWIALKSLYTSHYLHASLRLLRILQDPAAGREQVCYVIVVERLMFDNEVGGLTRTLLGQGLRKFLRERLTALRERVAEHGEVLAAR